MTKNESLIMKGIALLMMIMVHIDTIHSSQIINIGGISLWSVIAGGCYPVSFFLMLSGYGLRYVYENGDNHHWGRLIKLFVHYWAILFVFVFIGCFKVGSDVYPGDLSKFAENVTSFHTSYNYECWFLFPFLFLSTFYPIICKLMDKTGIVFLVFVGLIYFLAGYIISHYHLIYKTAPHLSYNLIQIFYLLLPFSIGVWMKKVNLFEWLNKLIANYKYYKVISLVLIVILLIVKIPIKTTMFAPFFAFAEFVLIWLIIQGRSNRTLSLIGKHSMNMWMIHTYFLHYIFHNELFKMKWSILILIATLCLSMICSFVINLLTTKIDKLIYNQKI